MKNFKCFHGYAERTLDAVTSRLGIILFFGLILVIGLVVAKDYGISWDEKTMHALGQEAYNAIFHGGAYPLNPSIRYHGAWFEILLYAGEKLAGLRYARHIYILRHAMSFVFYWIGLIVMYFLALRSFKSRRWALIATLFLLLSPRLFGHSFVNSRDIPAMVCFMIKMLTLLYFLERPTVGRALVHGLASGLMLSLRIGGLFVPIYVALFFGLRILDDARTKKKVDWKHYGIVLSVYVVTFGLATIALWPLLWSQPFGHFVEAMTNMMTTQQDAGGFYMGTWVSGVLPWHWIPVNVITKTPLLYTALFLAGAVELIVGAFRRPQSLLRERRDALLFLLWFMIPVLIVIFLQGHLFDEWRHVYFIYPGYILVAVYGLRILWDRAGHLNKEKLRLVARSAITITCSWSLLWSITWMIQNHPLEYVYFSFPSKWIDGYFALDYWGLSYRQGFEWILAHDPSDLITVQVRSSPGWENLNILTQDQRRRIVVKNEANMTKYVLDNYHETQYKHTMPAKDEIHTVQISGMDVLSIYRNPYWTPAADAGTQRMEDYEVQERFAADNTP